MERYKSVLFAFLMLTAWSMLVMNSFASSGLPEFLSSIPYVTLSRTYLD